MFDVHPILAAGAHEVGVVADLVIVLGAATVMALVMRRLGVAVIPAFLLAGIVLGPRALALVPDPGKLGAISQLAIVVLLFGIGLELHLSTLRGRATQLLGTALLACGACVLVGWGIVAAFGFAAPHALLVAMALSLSSTAVVLKELARRRQLHHPVGRFSIAILVVQDLAVVVMLAVLPLLASWAGLEARGGGSFAGVGDVLLRLLAVAAIVGGSRWLIVPLLKEALRGGGPELLLLVGLAYALGIAWATEALGFSLEMGAFLAGFVLSGTRFRHELSNQVVPVRDLFLAVFFTTLGMQVDPALVLDSWFAVLAAAAVLMLAKAAIIGVSCWLFGAPPSVSAVVGLSLAQAGEFSLVLLGAATGIGLLGQAGYGLLVGVVVLSLLATPSVMALGRRLAKGMVEWRAAPWLRASAAAEDDDESEPRCPPVVIGGFGPVGQRLALDLEEAGIAYRVIELNARTVDLLHEQNRSAVLGDVASEGVLLGAGLPDARALVLTVPDPEGAAGACVIARRLKPDLHITVRTAFAASAPMLRGVGADEVVVDEMAAGDRLAALVMASLETRREA